MLFMARRTLSRRRFLRAALTLLPASAAAHGFWLEPTWLLTRGMGYFFCDLRFCCRPEITVIEI
jgi:predicted MPP superfamily phosphohydrolase